MLLISITIILFIPYVWLLLYYRSAWKRIPDFGATQNAYSELPFISIIIAARNEEENIGKCIQSILGQTYPTKKYEIIVTDDHSTDKTVSIIESFGRDNIRVLHLADFVSGQTINSYKKKSIDAALKFANGELIVTTDADCMVLPGWLATIAAFYKEKSPVFVAMPVTFNNPVREDSFFMKVFKIFQSLDFLALQGITGAAVSKKIHAMCNGANLAYKKEVFFKVGGFEGIDKLASGDDMLLMQKIQAQYPDEIAFLKSKEVIVNTAPAETLKDFMNQRIRWASKTGSYTDKKIISVLLLVYLLNVWVLFLGILSCFFSEALSIFIISLLLKTLAELLFMFPVSRFFGKEKQLWWFLPAQPFHILYTVIAGWLGQFGSYQWKGRNVT